MGEEEGNGPGNNDPNHDFVDVIKNATLDSAENTAVEK